MSSPEAQVPPVASVGGPQPSIADAAATPQPRRLYAWVLLSAMLTTAAFPPLDLGFLAWAGLIPFYFAVRRAGRPGRAAALGYLFGWLHWGITVVWIGATVTNWAHTPLGWLAWAGLTGLKSLWFALFGLAAWWIARRPVGAARAAGLAAAWTIVEWLRGQTGIAMPWSLIGYTQYQFLPLIQAADIAGVYIVSFAIAWFNATLAGLLDSELRRSLARPGNLAGLLAPFGLICAMLLYGTVRLADPFAGPEVRLALIQPNVRSDRTDPVAGLRDLDRFRAVARPVYQRRPQLIIWPETVAPADVVTDGVTRSAFSEMARESGAFVLVGTSHTDESGRTYNSAALFRPGGELAARYDKRWLVPMGEWVPMRAWWGPLASFFHFPEDTTPGRSDAPLQAGPVRMAVLICYESVFPILPRIGAMEGANLMVSITNDSWAGESSELQQHHAMTLFRAVETRRFVASSATTGITALIGPDGNTRKVAPYCEDSLVAEARLRNETTVYMRIGDAFVGLCGLGVALLLRGKSR